MQEPTSSGGGAPDMASVWGQGARLGIVWVGLFAVAAILVYLLLGPLGWSGTYRALCAMGVGPVVGGVGIAGWWMLRRPALGQARTRQGDDSDHKNDMRGEREANG